MGVDIPAIPDLACSLRGLAVSTDVPATSARGLLGWVSGLGFRAVALDATHPELRARTLDRSSRRDIAASLKRIQLCLAGVDVFVPAGHFADAEHSDRAAAAVLRAIELAHDLSALGAGERPTVCVDLPDTPVEGVVSAIAGEAERHGVVVATLREGHTGVSRSVDLDALAEASVDPTAQLASESCVQARWGGPRVERRVELMPVAATLAMKQGGASCVLDLSHGRDVHATAQRGLDAWQSIELFG